MEKQHTLKILNSLANGVHPATGEAFASDSPYQHPDTVRALFEAIRSIDGAAATPEPQKKPTGTFLRWTSEEEQRLVAGVDAGKSTADLAQLHDRSRAAIEARLLKLGKIDVSALTVQLRYRPSGE
jgi:hypothetical protein